MSHPATPPPAAVTEQHKQECLVMLMQKAIKHAEAAGVRAVGAHSPSDPGARATGAAAKLGARRISGFWLQQYLTLRQQI